MLHGVVLGEYAFDNDKFYDVIRENYIDKGLNFVQFHGRFGGVPRETAIEWVKFLVENKLYFGCSYAHGRGTDRNKDPNPTEYPSFADKEFYQELKDIAGKYYVFNKLGEIGTEYACTDILYHPNRNHGKDMAEANQNFREIGRAHV